MQLPRRARGFIAPVVVLVLAVVGYAVVFQGVKAAPQRMSALVVAHTGLAGMKGKAARSAMITPADENWSVVKQAAAADADQTAGYARTWESTKSGTRAISVLVQVLPSSADATRLQQQVEDEYTDAKTLQKQKTTVTARFSVPRVAGSRGFEYTVAASGSGSTATSATNGVAITFVVGRAVAVVYDEAPTTAARGGNVRTVAESQSSLLQREEPGFSLTEPTRSLPATLLYFLIALAVAACTYFVPLGVQRARRNRRAHQAVQASYGQRARGGKVLQRHKSSPLLQPNRRRI